MSSGWIKHATFALIVLWAGPTLADDTASTAPDPFPRPAAIQGNVSFWIRVFSEWTTGQVAIHHTDHPELVYEVVDLPGPIRAGYTDGQKEVITEARNRWADYLRYLELYAGNDQKTDDTDRQWILHITTLAGTDGLRGACDRVRTQRGLRERFREGLERSSRYSRRMVEIFREAGLPEDLIYLPHVESSFQYQARSSAGAAGIWQFTRGTGKLYMTINSAIDERLDPIAATQAAAGYLRDAYKKLGAWPLAVTSYNHGVGGMTRALERFGTDFDSIYREYDGPLFGFASKNFYAEFLAARDVARDPSRYFPEGHSPAPPMDENFVVLESGATPQHLSRLYGVGVAELASLNLGWSSRATHRGLALPAGTRVWLPRSASERNAGSVHAAAESGSYVVQRGDTLLAISKRLDVPLARLLEINDMSASSGVIHPGQSLRVRGESENSSSAPDKTHVVRRGETLLRIATQYRVQLADILTANTLTPKSVIHPGQVLRIPLR